MTQNISGAADSRLRELEEECRRLQAQVNDQSRELSILRASFGRYETALRASHVAVFTQDHDLRYTSLSTPVLDRAADDILGRTDYDLFPGDSGKILIALKREALAGAQSKRAQFSFETGSGLKWFDIRIEPLRDGAANIVGLTGAAVDITERKEAEAHLRLLMRELTHRSKNLLAVIQAMARQTARHAGSTDAFLRQFSSRLQALAASHDLLIRESWHGASLREIIRAQLAVYVDVADGQVAVDGEAVSLKPEAAQSLGLAFHELAMNAARFGALSVPEGRVSIDWSVHDRSIDLNWRERNGPKVRARRKKGFGSVVIEDNLTRALDAKVDMAFEAGGLRCHIIIPTAQIQPQSAP